MIELLSIEFWISILFLINFIFTLFLFFLIKKVNRMDLDDRVKENRDVHSDYFTTASESAGDIVGVIEPLVKESEKVAITFDGQIKEKKRLLKELNDALDSRIISINLLLSRADALQKKMGEKQNQKSLPSSSASAVFDQQNQIINMYNQSFDADTIAQKLSIPKGEVLLVIDLKKKFVAMEKNGR